MRPGTRERARRTWGLAFALALLAPATRVSGSDVVLEWNAIALRTTAAAAFNPPLESRNLAIVQAAVFDAVNSITGQFEPYAAAREAAAGADPAAAALAAAHRALARLYPAQAERLAADYAASLGRLAPGPARAAGLAQGEAVADALLALRGTDGAQAALAAAYVPGQGPGVWVPTPPALLPALDPGWGALRPFVLESGAQFRPAPAPALDSAEYARDLAEVRVMGAARSDARTPAQTNLARVWIATGPQNWNPVARQVAAARGLTLSQNARLFALLNLAGADAFIAAWDSKYVANQWRPVTAIRTLDPAWTPLLETPPFPDYVAGHTTYGGAVERVLARLLGRAGLVLRVTSPTAPGVELAYETFEELSQDVVDARVWGGIHWRTSCTRGRAVGQRVGDYTVDHALQPTAASATARTPPRP